MPKQGITYEILIASPSDVVAERDIVSACARDWNSAHSASGVHVRDHKWELDAVPAMGERGQAVINHQLVDDADILIGIFKARIGTPTGTESRFIRLIRVRIQTRWRATTTATTTAKAKTLIRKNIDISDLLIQNAHLVICDRRREGGCSELA